MWRITFQILLIIELLFISFATYAAESESSTVADLETLKIDIIALNREVTLLKEQLTFPDKQKISVYFSYQSHLGFELEQLKLLLDGQIVTEQSFEAKFLTLLEQGGATRLFLGNIVPGEHVITAFFTGKLADGEPYKRGITANFVSGEQPLSLALSIGPDHRRRQVEFSLVEL